MLAALNAILPWMSLEDMPSGYQCHSTVDVPQGHALWLSMPFYHGCPSRTCPPAIRRAINLISAMPTLSVLVAMSESAFPLRLLYSALEVTLHFTTLKQLTILYYITSVCLSGYLLFSLHVNVCLCVTAAVWGKALITWSMLSSSRWDHINLTSVMTALCWYLSNGRCVVNYVTVSRSDIDLHAGCVPVQSQVWWMASDKVYYWWSLSQW